MRIALNIIVFISIASVCPASPRPVQGLGGGIKPMRRHIAMSRTKRLGEWHSEPKRSIEEIHNSAFYSDKEIPARPKKKILSRPRWNSRLEGKGVPKIPIKEFHNTSISSATNFVNIEVDRKVSLAVQKILDARALKKKSMLNKKSIKKVGIKKVK